MGLADRRLWGWGVLAAVSLVMPASAVAEDITTDPRHGLPARFTADNLGSVRAGVVTRSHLSEHGEAVTVTDAWRLRGDHLVEQVSLEREGVWVRADGSPLPPSPGDEARLDGERYELSYTRGWRAPAIEAGGLSIAVTPHAGLGVGSEGLTPKAGARLTIGDRLDRLAPDGQQAFGDRGRWYLFAAGEGRAVGYNFARTRDGEFERAGFSQDRGAYIGDASVGVAWRRGATQASFGYVYREHKVRGWRTSETIDRDRSEGLLAVQLSIKPDW